MSNTNKNNSNSNISTRRRGEEIMIKISEEKNEYNNKKTNWKQISIMDHISYQKGKSKELNAPTEIVSAVVTFYLILSLLSTQNLLWLFMTLYQKGFFI